MPSANCSRNLIPQQTWIRVELLLREDWSPQQISRWLAQNEGLGVSHESIYKHVKEDKMSGGDLHTHLRCRKKRRKRYGTPSRKGQIKNRICIDQRPEVVDRRSRIGDWEADTLLGSRKKSKVLVTLAERKSPLLPYSRLRGQKSQFRLPGHTRGDCAHAQQLRDGDVR